MLLLLHAPRENIQMQGGQSAKIVRPDIIALARRHRFHVKQEPLVLVASLRAFCALLALGQMSWVRLSAKISAPLAISAVGGVEAAQRYANAVQTATIQTQKAQRFARRAHRELQTMYPAHHRFPHAFAVHPLNTPRLGPAAVPPVLSEVSRIPPRAPASASPAALHAQQTHRAPAWHAAAGTAAQMRPRRWDAHPVRHPLAPASSPAPASRAHLRLTAGAISASESAAVLHLLYRRPVARLAAASA